MASPSIGQNLRVRSLDQVISWKSSSYERRINFTNQCWIWKRTLISLPPYKLFHNVRMTSTGACGSLFAYISSVVSPRWGKLNIPSPKGRFLALQTGYVVRMHDLGSGLLLSTVLIFQVLIDLSREQVTIWSRDVRDQSIPYIFDAWARIRVIGRDPFRLSQIKTSLE